LSYIQTKEIIELHTNHYNVFQTITLTTFVIIIISICCIYGKSLRAYQENLL